MKLFVFIALIALLSCVSAEDSDVLVLNSENFQKTIEASPLIAVEFFAPWCGHCKALAPEWETAASALKGKVPIAKVDCTEEQELCQEHEVKGYPTLKLFRNGEAEKLEVTRKAEPIIAFLSAELAPALTTLTKEEVATFIAEHPFAVIGFFSNNHDDRFTTFDQIATKLKRGASFGVVINNELEKPEITLYKKFDDPIVTYKGELTSDDVSNWISRQKVPLLAQISQENYQSYADAQLPIGYLFLDPEADNTQILDVVREAAKKVRNHVSITWIDNAKFGQHAVRLGLSGKVVPSFAIDNSDTKYLYPEDQEITTEKLDAWLAKFVAGEIQPFVKSEPTPETNDDPIKIVTANTFDEIVKKSKKHVLVEFYAPWCGHCKKLAPIYEELAIFFQQYPDIVIAKLDGSANDMPSKLNVRGFPTVILFPAENKESPITFQGQRDLISLKQFVANHAGITLPEEPEEEEEGDEHVHDEL